MKSGKYSKIFPVFAVLWKSLKQVFMEFCIPTLTSIYPNPFEVSGIDRIFFFLEKESLNEVWKLSDKDYQYSVHGFGFQNALSKAFGKNQFSKSVFSVSQ